MMTWCNNSFIHVDSIEESPSELPSQFYIGEVCIANLEGNNNEIFQLPCIVVGVKFTACTVSYDLAFPINSSKIYSVQKNLRVSLQSANGRTKTDFVDIEPLIARIESDLRDKQAQERRDNFKIIED